MDARRKPNTHPSHTGGASVVATEEKKALFPPPESRSNPSNLITTTTPSCPDWPLKPDETGRQKWKKIFQTAAAKPTGKVSPGRVFAAQIGSELVRRSAGSSRWLPGCPDNPTLRLGTPPLIRGFRTFLRFYVKVPISLHLIKVDFLSSQGN